MMFKEKCPHCGSDKGWYHQFSLLSHLNPAPLQIGQPPKPTMAYETVGREFFCSCHHPIDPHWNLQNIKEKCGESND
jgi:hypothetical protein